MTNIDKSTAETNETLKNVSTGIDKVNGKLDRLFDG
jgi:hypothetical protein